MKQDRDFGQVGMAQQMGYGSPDGPRVVPNGSTPIDSMRRTVEAEIEASGGIVDYLNNFKTRLRPDGVGNFGNVRVVTQNLGFLNDLNRRHAFTDMLSEHSRLWLNQTAADFFRAIDEAMTQEGVTPERVEEMDQEARQQPGNQAKYEPLSRYILPVYVRLRAQGYTSTDLTI